MRTQPPHHQAYVLWLIREGKAATLGDLWTHFAELGPTGMNMVGASLEALERAHLIEAEPKISSLREVGLSPGELKNISLSVTPLLKDVQNALRVSITQLASSDPSQRLVVTSILNRTFSTKYKSDILVLMPFAVDMEPVYQDHIKSVAARLEKSVARADDFFTSEHIIDEIWTAIIESGIIIADCSTRNPNVFYEIGLCHAIGKKTILITRDKDDVPFDLRHRRYIEYQFTPRGMKEFEETLQNTLVTELQNE